MSRRYASGLAAFVAVSLAPHAWAATAATPVFSPGAGLYSSRPTVTISDTTSGAKIFYTTDGSTPTTSSTLYSGGITVSTSETVKAIAAATGFTDSAVASATYTLTAAKPTFTPGASTSSNAQTVTISDATPGAKIYYTTDGSSPTTSSTLYSGAITVSTNETVKAIAAATGFNNSAVATYTLTTATPTFSPGTGVYSSRQTVTISDATSGAKIYYTTNGTIPTTGSTLYSGAITVSTSETVKAIAAATGFNNSAVASATYTLTAAKPTFTPGASTSSNAQTVTISDATPGAKIYYTTDGSSPTTSSTLYSGAITVSTNETVKAIAAATGFNKSAVATYTLTTATPIFSPRAGVYSSRQSVTISDATSGAKIYYTTNGTIPTTGSTLYTGAITVSTSETVKAIAAATGFNNSAVASATYTLTAAKPTFTPGASTSSNAQTVNISDATPGAKIYYTTDGSSPTTSSTLYSGAIAVSTNETVKAIAAATGFNNSAVATYTLTTATPIFSPGTGLYSSRQTVTISDATSGAKVYYTTDGSTPTTSSTLYGGGITVSTSQMVKAIAAATGFNNSAVASATYTLTAATPTFSPGAGTYSSAQTVTISDTTPGAKIHYTTDGSTPTTSSTLYSGAISVSTSETVKAIATASGYSKSAVGSATYAITPPAATPTLIPGAGTYSSAQTVTISDTTPGAKIYYTTDGSTPTTSSTLYSGAILVSTSETVKAIAAATGFNNSAVASATYTLTLTRPDLTVTSVSAMPTTVGAGCQLAITDTIRATGAGTPAFAVKYFLSTDQTITSGATYLGSRAVSSLAAGASNSATTTVTLPVGLTGPYYVGAIVDANAQVTESDETNNARAGNLVTINKPDLTVTSVRASPTNLLAGAELAITDVLLASTAGAGPFVVKYYLSTDSTITSSDTLVGQRSVGSLAAGVSNTATTMVKVPARLTGSYHVGAIVDANNQVDESDETNNATVGSLISVRVPAMAVAGTTLVYDPAGHLLGIYDVGSDPRNCGTAGFACSGAQACCGAGACGHMSGSTCVPGSATIEVSIAPAAALVTTQTTRQFSATVTNTSNHAVFWEVNGVRGGNSQIGTITAQGLYAAPLTISSSVTVTVTAVSQADTSKYASALVAISGPLAPLVVSGVTCEYLPDDTPPPENAYGMPMAGTTMELIFTSDDLATPQVTVDGMLLPSHDGSDNVTSIDDQIGTGSLREMTYDPLDRLKTATANDLWGLAYYEYDELGNRTLERLGSDVRYTYDSSNRLAAFSESPDHGTVTFTWDEEGRLASSSDGVSYLYDGRGRRVQKSEPAQTTVYHYDPSGHVIAETLPDGTKLREYFYLGNRLIAVDGCVSSNALPCNERQWYHTDALGSVIARSDEGGVVARLEYQPWGEEWSHAGVTGDRQYNGRVYDPGTGFHDYGARLYWPQIGRFISADSYQGDIANPASLNRYSYVQNNPYKYTDPTGHVGEPQIEAVVTAVEEDAPEIEAKVQEALPELEAQAEAAGARVMEAARASCEAQDAVGRKTMELARQLGNAGEKAVRAIRDLGKKTAFRFEGDTFINDGETETEINEVKNVGYQSLTKQIRGEIADAAQKAKDFLLHVRGGPPEAAPTGHRTGAGTSQADPTGAMMPKRGPRKGKSVTELMAELEANPEWVARRDERKRVMDAKKVALRAAQESLLEDLAAVGWQVASVWDLVNARVSYPAAVPVLLRHLLRPYPPEIRDGIARALAVPEAHQGWNELVREFENEKDTSPSGMKWSLALALAAASTDAELDQVLSWVSDPSLGENRAALLGALARSGDPRSLEKLNELVKEPTLKEDAEKALRRRTRKRK